ncbi:MAG TPA: M56 family metallopeptidase [Anaeromyxobacteraceae bacterium]|nr:M56 family metallopeptidase [Anaeromyxobacteraceae bacterium]
MLDATWADVLSEAILHTFVASLFVEALVRSWRVREPNQRVALRAIALGLPLVVFPVLAALPIRRGERFRDEWALFAGERFDAFSVAGVGLWELGAAVLAAAGLTLLLLDLVPLLRRRRLLPPAAPIDAADPVLGAPLARVAAALRVPAPPIVRLDDGAPVLFCTGVRRPALVISRGALALLDRDELPAALAHEVAHLAARDPATSWALMGARMLQAVNPAYQVLARAVARDLEWRADERAAAACGDRLALASGLLKLHRATSGVPTDVRRSLPFAPALTEPVARLRDHDVEVRCRRLLDPPPPPLPFGAWRVALAGASLTALLFFVV